MGFRHDRRLHYNAPGHTLAFAQWPLPDHDHAPAFWRPVVRTLPDDHSGMAFEVFNEPYDLGPARSPGTAWMHGCTLPNLVPTAAARRLTARPPAVPTLGISTATSGRSASRTPIGSSALRVRRSRSSSLGAPTATTSASGWRTSPAPQLLGASVPCAPTTATTTGCDTVDCFAAEAGRVADRVPVTATEYGQFDCRHDVMDAFQDWADAKGALYQAHGWYVADFPPCGNSAADPRSARRRCCSTTRARRHRRAKGFKEHLQVLHDQGASSP